MNYRYKTRVTELHELAKTLVPAHTIIGCFLFGSQNYDCDVEGSDVDVWVLVVPTLADFVFNKQSVSFEHVLETGEHLRITDIRNFMHELRKMNPNALEALFTEYAEVSLRYVSLWNRLKAMRDSIVHYNRSRFLKVVVAMFRQTYRKLTVNGYDSKLASLLCRLESTCYNYIFYRQFTFKLPPDEADACRRIKTGELTVTDEELKNAATFMEEVNKFLERNASEVDKEVGVYLDQVQKEFALCALATEGE